MSIYDLIQILLLAGSVIFFVALIVGIQVLSTRSFAKKTARLEQQALERGWRYQGLRQGSTESHNFSGETNHVPWQIESYYYHSSNNRSSSSARYTRWWTETVSLSGEVVLLIPNVGNTFQAFSSMSAGGAVSGVIKGLVGDLVQMFLNYFVTNVLHAAPEDARAFEGAQQVQAGSEALRQHYTVVATNALTASRFLDEDAEQMLLELVSAKWNDGQKLQVMAVVYWQKGIQLVAEGQIVDIDKLEQIVRLGLALVSGQKPSVWS
jgi:hypothetical protein